ncbi:hypothetical protein HanIR_Chr12g0601451 [Helianthus annuus]|nr:hypothetical protein HanIR_Chr12g0601451 [Helianthus annuus]
MGFCDSGEREKDSTFNQSQVATWNGEDDPPPPNTSPLTHFPFFTFSSSPSSFHVYTKTDTVFFHSSCRHHHHLLKCFVCSLYIFESFVCFGGLHLETWDCSI